MLLTTNENNTNCIQIFWAYISSKKYNPPFSQSGNKDKDAFFVFNSIFFFNKFYKYIFNKTPSQINNKRQFFTVRISHHRDRCPRSPTILSWKKIKKIQSFTPQAAVTDTNNMAALRRLGSIENRCWPLILYLPFFIN